MTLSTSSEPLTSEIFRVMDRMKARIRAEGFIFSNGVELTIRNQVHNLPCRRKSVKTQHRWKVEGKRLKVKGKKLPEGSDL